MSVALLGAGAFSHWSMFMTDKRIDRHELGREKGIQEAGKRRDDTRQAKNSPHPTTTPPPEARTDPDRGTGEMGTENLDPSQPLNKE
jgi:hypothetical protein